MATFDEMESYIYTLIEPLVTQPDDIAIEMEETDEFYEFHVRVHADDVGRVIGKKGRVAKALRTILYNICFEADKRVRLTIQND